MSGSPSPSYVNVDVESSWVIAEILTTVGNLAGKIGHSSERWHTLALAGPILTDATNFRPI